MAISAVTRTDVAACVRAIARTHSSNTAAAARRALSAFFAWAIADGLLGDGANPVDGSHRPADSEPRDHVLTDAELVNVWKACGDDDYGRIVRLLILTRRSPSGDRRPAVGRARPRQGRVALAERTKQERPRARRCIDAGGAGHPLVSAARWRLLVRVSRRRFFAMGGGEAGARRSPFRHRAAVALARHPQIGRNENGRHRHRAAHHRGVPKPL